MLGRKLFAVVAGLLSAAGSIQAQEWRSAGVAPDGWKPSGSTPEVQESPAAQELPSVSTFRNVQQGPAGGATPPVRSTRFDERMPLTDTLPPPSNPNPAPPKAVLGPLKTAPKACLAPPTTPQPADSNWLYRQPGCADAAPAAPVGFDPNALYRPRGQVWLIPEYLLWRTSSVKIAPLATASPVGTAQSQAGVLGNSSTTVLLGDQKILGDWRSGVRLNAGFWINDDQTFGMDGGFFYLGTKHKNDLVSSTGDPLLSRPFLDASTGLQSSQVIAFTTRNADGSLSPAQVGTVGLQSSTELWGADIGFRLNLVDGPAFRLDGIVGFRYLYLADRMSIGDTIEANDPNAEAGIAYGATYASLDTFDTRSGFYGGQLGLKGEYTFGRWSIGMMGKVSIGSTVNQVSINGYTLTNVPGNSSTVTSGGLLAQPTNIGVYNSSSFSVVPEFGLNLGYQVTEHVRLFAGYSGLYWSNVVRAGKQIDYAVNSTQLSGGALVGPARPGFVLKESGFWASGATVGLELRW